MIKIIFGPPRVGKTAFMTAILVAALFDRQRRIKTQQSILRMNASGFNYTVPTKPVVCANYDVTGKKFGYNTRITRRINPFRLGYANPFVETHFIESYTVIGITEGQKYFNSRMSRLYPSWQSRFMEQHGHNGYDIYIDVQRPMLIDVNIRELAEFTEIRKKESKDGKTIWHVRNIPGSAELDRYIASGKKDTTCYTEEKVVIDYDVHQCYDHQMCKPKFFEGYLRQDFDTIEAEPIEESLEGYIKYLQEVDDELPPGFYRKEAV